MRAALLALARCLGFAAGMAHTAFKASTRDLYAQMKAEREYRDAVAQARRDGALYEPPLDPTARPN